MPHISLKMLHGRAPEQKQRAVEKLTNALCEALECDESFVSVSVEDYTPAEWQTVFAKEIADNPAVVKFPKYNPKDLL